MWRKRCPAQPAAFPDPAICWRVDERHRRAFAATAASFDARAFSLVAATVAPVFPRAAVNGRLGPGAPNTYAWPFQIGKDR